MTPIIQSLSEISDRYDALYCDLWGCLHNGVAVYPEAVAALRAFRAKGGAVVLMTNAPRPAMAVAGQLARLGAPDDIRDLIVASGDAARDSVVAGDWGARTHHIGAPKDEPFFEGLTIERVPLADAESVIVTGLRDDRTETPDDYADELREARLRGLALLNANPDLYVDVGDRRAWCGGALARAYAAIGGKVTEFGKPHAPIYDLARRRLADMGRDPDRDRILCVGDGVLTDIAGAMSENLDALFVTGGLAAARMGPDPQNPDPALVDAFLGEHSLSAAAAIGRLR